MIDNSKDSENFDENMKDLSEENFLSSDNNDDIQSEIKELLENDVDMSENAENNENTDSLPDVEELAQKVKELTEENARARADHYNLQQEYSNYVRRSKAEIPQYKNSGIESVVLAILAVFDDIDAAKKHGDLNDGPFASIASKLESTLKENFDVERFGTIGEEFDPNVHEALLVSPNPDVENEQIGDIIQSGWKIKDKIIRAAKVVVFSPQDK